MDYTHKAYSPHKQFPDKQYPIASFTIAKIEANFKGICKGCVVEPCCTNDCDKIREEYFNQLTKNREWCKERRKKGKPEGLTRKEVEKLFSQAELLEI